MSKKTKIFNGVHYEYVEDQFGDEDEKLSENESPSSTHYRHWEEENHQRKLDGREPKEYKPLDDNDYYP